MSLPAVDVYLPGMLPFIDQLAQDFCDQKLTAWAEMAARVREFFTPEMMGKVDAVIPGWVTMASYGNQTTLIHVTAVLASLVLCPEYQAATPDQQKMMQWIVLFHDVAKRYQPGKRDHIHGFRSAAITGGALPKSGFPMVDEKALPAWIELTNTAITHHAQTGEEIHDNHRLPEIMAGIDTIFGQHSPAALIIKAVLLHMSINVLAEWGQMAPLSDAEIRQYIDRDLCLLLKIMNMMDNDAWGFFEPERKQREREETLGVFTGITSN